MNFLYKNKTSESVYLVSIIMPRHSQSSKRKSNELPQIKTKLKKRRLVDDKFIHDKTLVSNLEEIPTKSYEIPVLIGPKDNSADLNRDSSIIFEITTKENEYFYFNKDFQIMLEMSIIDHEHNNQGVFTRQVLLHKKIPTPPAPPDANADDATTLARLKQISRLPPPVDENKFAYVPSTSGLSIFKNITVSYMNNTKDESLTFPQEGVFLNLVTAQDFFLSPQKFQETQKRLNNFKISNQFLIGSGKIPENLNKMRFAKLHKTKTDGPVIPNVEENNVGGAASGKVHYLYISRTPFVANNPYVSSKYNLEDQILFPPKSTVRIVLYKNDLSFKFLSMHKEIDIPAQINNNNNTENAWRWKKVSYYLHNIYLAINRIKISPEHPISNKHFYNNITANHFDLIELTSATSQKIPINWRSNTPPMYIVISFLRQQDVIFNTTKNLPQALNQFLLPAGLTSLTVRDQDYINEVFDGIKIENLDVQDHHKSKHEYIEYLKKHNFVADSFEFEDMFSLDATIETGVCNIFPVNLVGREIKSDPLSNGLELELKFRNPNVAGWFASIRSVFLGQQWMSKEGEKNYKVNFKYH